MIRHTLVSGAAIAMLASCAGQNDTNENGVPPAGDAIGDASDSAAGTRPAGEPQLMTVEGRISDGVECPILTTPDGLVYSLSLESADFGPGDYVRITGELADASLCMQGEGHLLPESIAAADPPARDRDPARAGGVRLTREYALGSWAAQGGDCTRPDFAVSGNSAGGQVIETSLNGSPRTGYVRLGPDPAFIFDQPMREMAIETRGPDGLAVMPPESGPLSLGGRRIEGDGVVFVKCAERG